MQEAEKSEVLTLETEINARGRLDSSMRTFFLVHVFDGVIYSNEYDNSPCLNFFRSVQNS